MGWLIFKIGAQSVFLYHGGMLLFSIFTLLIMWAIISNTSHWNKLMTNNIFNWIGSRSYEIYVYQLPVFIFFGDKFKDVANHQWSYAIIEIILIIIISELSYHFVEIPFGKFNYKHIFHKISQLFRNHIQIREIIFGMIFLIGGVGILQSTIINPKQANHTQLAIRIQKNSKTEKDYNKNLVKTIKSGKKIERSNKDKKQLEKNGLSSSQLNEAQNLSGSAIGDSVMLAGHDDLQEIFPKLYIDAQVSRQPVAAVPDIKNLANQGLLGKNVIIGLGTNGNVSPTTMKQIMNIVGPHRHVFWINVHIPSQPWQNSVNSMLLNSQKNIKIYMLSIGIHI